MNRLIEIPKPRDIAALENKYRVMPAMREMYQREAEVLTRLSDLGNDFVGDYKIRNFKRIHDGFERIASLMNMPSDTVSNRVRGWLVGQLMKGAKINSGMVKPYGCLEVVVKHRDGREYDLGLVSVNKVTTAFVNYLTDALHVSADISLFKFHGSGTGNTPEANSQAALVTEVDTRVSGNQTEGASANIYHTEAELVYTTSRNIVEHGVFTASSSGTMMDRSVFSTIAVDTNTNILFKYELTSTAEA